VGFDGREQVAAKTGAGFKSLADARPTPRGRKAGYLTVLGALAEFKRRAYPGSHWRGASANARGVHMGMPPKADAAPIGEARQRRDNGETLTGIARTYGVAHHGRGCAVHRGRRGSPMRPEPMIRRV
jgi:hypothetical protein